ncbi:MAG: acyltransferase family protein [Trebonia sp.]
MRAEGAVPSQGHEQREDTGTRKAEGKPRQRGFRPDIQGMRALAVTMVVLYHLRSSLLPGGFAGVDVFFVISGFLITGHLLREYRTTGRIRLLEFWGRRAKRLVPAAALVLTVTWVASRFLLPATRLAGTAAQILASALYFQNWRLAGNAVDYLKSDSAASPVVHFWSLSVEEQFYLGWPLLFVVAALVALTAAREARRSRGHLAMLVLAGAVVVASLWYSVTYTQANPAGAYFVTTTRIWELGVGGLLALLPARVSERVGRFGPLGWVGLGLVIASAFLLNGTTAFPGASALLPVGGSALLILGGSAAGRFGPSKLTSARSMVFLGGISYSLYLWHWPIIVLWTTWRGHPADLISGPAIVAVSVILSWLTKIWVEDPVRNASLLSGHGWRSVSMALAAVVPVTLATVFIVGEPAPWNGRLGPDHPGAAVLASAVTGRLKSAPEVPPPAAIELPTYWQQGCLVAEASDVPKECVYGDTKDPVLTVALIGDSQAGDWFTPLQQIAGQRHWKLVTDLHAICPWTSTMMITKTGAPYTACHAWGAAVVHDMITHIKPDVVITSDIQGLATVKHPDGGASAQQAIGTGMNAYWKQLEGHGTPVIAIRESPVLRVNMPECISKYPKAPWKCAVPRSRAIKPDVPTVYATRAAAGSVPLINMNSLICGPEKCPAVVGNVLVYQDNHHLTRTYSLTMTPYLEKRLLAVSKTLAKAR